MVRHLNWLLAQILFVLLKLARLLPTGTALNIGGWLCRNIGPLLPEHRVARNNLAAAFPEMSERQRKEILTGAWDNLGRTGAEYVFLDRIFDFDPENPDSGHFEVDGIKRFLAIRDSGKPAILFSAHLANWEILAVCAAVFDLDMTALFRPPNNAFIAERLDRVRRQTMGKLVPSMTGAAIALSSALERGERVGLLVDQFYHRGPGSTFFGRKARTNPTLGILARRFDCPVYGARTIRLAGGRFRLELEGPYDLPRDASGEIDIDSTMQMVTSIVEGWVREHPDQWLWMHRRWRD
ncbi:MAG TPA: lipid A biosynthesis lauroyl acyltransferase [Afifellaceae bacterium]|nr:lipid A biosynthesis lauroyl acyltransferase [Afifellaceae bacterium]